MLKTIRLRGSLNVLQSRSEPAHSYRAFELTKSLSARATYPKVGLRFESDLMSREKQGGRETRETLRTRVELDRTENLNLTSAYQHLESPRAGLCPSPVPSFLLVRPTMPSYNHAAPIDLPSHLASLPPATATRTPIRNGGAPLAVGCRLLSARDMRSDPRNDRCAPRRRPRIA